MLLSAGSHISIYDNKRFVINTCTGRNLLVNEATVQMFLILQTAQYIEDALAQFNYDFNTNVSLNFFENLILERFGGYGILRDEKGITKSLPAEYIRLKVQIFSHKMASTFAKPLKVLYTPWLFWPIFIGTLFFLIKFNLIYKYKLIDDGYWIAIPLIYISIFIHEFGHIAACSKFNIRHGGIGFGFYLFLFPVLYADVTNIWQAGKHHRIITNLGGIFSQMLYATLLGCLYLLTKFTPILYASITVTMSALWQLNPFVRHDGYWLLSDLTNTPNLLGRASLAIKKAMFWQTYVRVYQTRGENLSIKKVFLVIYSLSNTTIIILFAYFTISRYGNQLRGFPDTLYSLSHKIFSQQISFNDLRNFPFIALTFYTFLVRYAIVMALKWKAKLGTQATNALVNS